MKTKLYISVLLLMLPFMALAQVTDRILLGNTDSETAHGLIAYCPDKTEVVSNGLMGQSGRIVKMFPENPFCGEYTGIYGGEYCFVLRIDGNAQNYITLKTNGGDAVNQGERYRVMIDNKDLQDYSRDAVSFGATKAAGAFAFNTLTIPRKATDGKTAVVVRVRSFGRYYGYATQGNFMGYQRAMTSDMPPIYAVYSSTNPYVSLSDEPQGQLASYATAPAKTTAETLAQMKARVESSLANAIKNQVNGSDFKPAYGNNNFNVVLAMGMAYQKGIFGTTANDLAKKIRTAIDSMVYINNLGKNGADITLSAEGQTATRQLAWAGWGGLYGQQGMGIYLLWKANKVTDLFLNNQVDLGAGKKSRREQWIEIFRESFDAGLTYSGRRYITNQLMEASHSVYGAALALYMLDPQTYHNAPKLGLRLMREAVGIDEYTGVPKNAKFDGSILDADGYPTYELGDPNTAASGTNYWGHHFHATTAMGNGREQGWTCTSCYGNLAGRITDMYLATLQDPFIGTAAVSASDATTTNGSPLVFIGGDPDILQVAVNNTKNQAYFTYPTVDSDGNRGIISESITCWRNRYDPGKNFYANLMAGYLANDEEILGHVWQAFQEGHFDPDTSGRLFPYYTNNYFLANAIDRLIEYGNEHSANYQPMPSAAGQPDYVKGDPQDGVVAMKHGDNYIFVNFMAEGSLLSPSMAHVITPREVKTMQFIPEVMKYYHSNHLETVAEYYWNGNHKITYPDKPAMAAGGMQYESPAYNANGDYTTARPLCQYYQQLLGQYLIAQNCSEATVYNLTMSDAINGKQAVDVATGKTVTLSASIQLAAGETKVYYIASIDGSTVATVSTGSATVPAGSSAGDLKSRVTELLAFAQSASTKLSDDKAPGTYSRTAFMPFFRELTMAAYIANNGTATSAEISAEAATLEEAYQTFTGTALSYDACTVPGRLDYTKQAGTTGSVTVKKTSMSNAKSGAQVVIPIIATEEGDYMVKVKAKGHVADQYKSSLNIDLLTVQEHYDGSKAIDNSRTQVIAYNDFDYTIYKWTIHLKANDVALLRYVFGGTSTTYTVDVSTTDIEAVTAADMLEIEIDAAQALLDSYDGSDLVSDEARAALAAAIATAKEAANVPDGSQSSYESAFKALQNAEKTFRSGIIVIENHVLDLDNAIYSNAGKHTVRWPNGNKGTALRTNAWGKLYIGRYDISTVKQILIRTNIKSHVQYCYGLRAYAVPAVATTTIPAGSSVGITTEDELKALSTDDKYRIGTFYGDETVDGEPLKEGSNTWKVGPQRTIDLQKHSITANEADFKSLWGSTAVVPATGYTYNDEEKTDIKQTFATEYNANFSVSEGICDLWVQFGAVKWGEMTIDEVIVVTTQEAEQEPEEFNGTMKLYPSKDLQLRIGNSNQGGTGSGIEVREMTADNHEYGFSGIMEFDLTAIQQKIAEGWQIDNVSLRLTDCSNNRSSKLAIRPFWSGWAEDKTTTYDNNADYIKSSIAGDLLTTVQLGRYGGKKAFELQGAGTQLNPFPVSSYQGTSTDNDKLLRYLTDSLDAGKTAISFLIGRDDDLSTQNCGFYTKDVLTGLAGNGQCSQYQWSATENKWVAIEGTENSITRTAAAMQFFGLTEAQFFAECAPMLTITMSNPDLDPSSNPVQPNGDPVETADELTQNYTVGEHSIILTIEKSQAAGETAPATHGTVTVKGRVKNDETQITITTKPDNGQSVSKLLIEELSEPNNVQNPSLSSRKRESVNVGRYIEPTDNGNGTYTFTMPENSVHIIVAFTANATGISDAARLNDNGQMTNHNVYDLQGRLIGVVANSQLSALQSTFKPGLYIINGKKIVIK